MMLHKQALSRANKKNLKKCGGAILFIVPVTYAALQEDCLQMLKKSEVANNPKKFHKLFTGSSLSSFES